MQAPLQQAPPAQVPVQAALPHCTLMQCAPPLLPVQSSSPQHWPLTQALWLARLPPCPAAQQLWPVTHKALAVAPHTLQACVLVSQTLPPLQSLFWLQPEASPPVLVPPPLPPEPESLNPVLVPPLPPLLELRVGGAGVCLRIGGRQPSQRVSAPSAKTANHRMRRAIVKSITARRGFLQSTTSCLIAYCHSNAPFRENERAHLPIRGRDNASGGFKYEHGTAKIDHRPDRSEPLG